MEVSRREVPLDQMGAPGMEASASDQVRDDKRQGETMSAASFDLVSSIQQSVSQGVELTTEQAVVILDEFRTQVEDHMVAQDACQFQKKKMREINQSGECISFGAYAHGPFSGVTNATSTHPWLVLYLNEYLRTRGATEGWPSFVTHLNTTPKHKDNHNMPGSVNQLNSLGPHEGGQLWVQDPGGRSERLDYEGQDGRILECKHKIVAFGPDQAHATLPFEGERWSISAYASRGFPKLTKQQQKGLADRGFNVEPLMALARETGNLGMTVDGQREEHHQDDNKQKGDETEEPAPVECDEYKAFVSDRILSPNEPFGEAADGKKPKKLDINKVDENTARGIHEARGQEWGKYQQYNAAVPIMGPMLDCWKAYSGRDTSRSPVNGLMLTRMNLRRAGAISRLVSCGNYEGVSRDELRCGDISSAYFQSEPLERVIIMKQPRGGLPGVPPEAVLLCRLPVYGTMDAGRGFYARLCKVSCEEGLKVSKIAPGLYYVLGSDNLPAVLLGTHVDDLLWCATPEGEAIMERIMAKFDMGKVEDTDFRYCGRRLRQDEDFNVTIDTEDNTRPIRHIVIDPNRKSTEPATDRDITRLRSVVGSLAWVARYSRPDLCYRVNCLQRACARATVADLRDANRVVDLAKADAGISMFYPAGKFSWHDACVVSFSDASHAGEEGLRSQQGRFHYITSEKMVGSNEHVAHTIGYGSTTIRRVCRSTLQAETYAMQSAVESGDRLRAIRQFYASCEASCRSLTDHRNSCQASKVSDRRLAIELESVRQQLWEGDSKTHIIYSPHGDRLRWTDTATQVADALTKSMKPFQLFNVMREAVVHLSDPEKKIRKNAKQSDQ
eukprot:s2743_g3.t2